MRITTPFFTFCLSRHYQRHHFVVEIGGFDHVFIRLPYIGEYVRMGSFGGSWSPWDQIKDNLSDPAL